MAKFAAYGTELRRDGETIAQVSNVGGPGLSGDTIDVTAHDSPDAWRRFIASLVDAGEVTFDVWFDPDDSDHQQVVDDLADRVREEWSVVWPDATSWTFDAFVQSFESSEPVDGAISGSVTLKLEGKPTLA